METDLQRARPILGNETELREMFTNLIFNAVDAMPTGGVIAINVGEEADHVVLMVKDMGVGMAEETLKRCMEPFFTTKGAKGTGMGLAIVYGIVQRYKGSIAIDSEVGKGTTVTVRFPVLPNNQDAAPSRQTPMAKI